MGPYETDAAREHFAAPVGLRKDIVFTKQTRRDDCGGGIVVTHLPKNTVKRARVPVVPDRVSCLMVTQEGRFEHFARSLRCYRRQDYPRRELVVVTAARDRYLKRLERCIESELGGDVSLVSVRPGLALGAQRNISL